MYVNNIAYFTQDVFEVLPCEIAFHRKLDHENIIKMFDYFEDEIRFYLVMEKPSRVIELFDQVLINEGLDEKISRYYFRQIVNAVQYCHSKGVVHRDIKLDNVIIDLDTNQTKLIDFGCAESLTDDLYTEHLGK